MRQKFSFWILQISYFFLIGDILFSNIPPTNTTSSSSTIRTTSTTIILITNMRSTDLHPCIYSRLWLFQIRTAASGTEAESIRLFTTSLSFRVVQNIVPLWRKKLYFRHFGCFYGKLFRTFTWLNQDSESPSPSL